MKRQAGLLLGCHKNGARDPALSPRAYSSISRDSFKPRVFYLPLNLDTTHRAEIRARRKCDLALRTQELFGLGRVFLQHLFDELHSARAAEFRVVGIVRFTRRTNVSLL
jgi:hypothetical protein